MPVAYTFPFFSLIGSLLGLGMMIYAYRFCYVGQIRYCKKCRYELTGLTDEHLQCPECGQNLDHAKATVTGKRKTNRGMLLFGLLIAIVCVSDIGIYAVKVHGNIKLIHYKPLFILQKSAISEYGGKIHPNTDELERRIFTKRLSQQQCQALVPVIFNLQKKHPRWLDASWQNVLHELLARKALTQKEVEQLLKNAFTASIQLKPTLRQGQSTSFGVNVHYRPLTPNIHYKTTKLARGMWIGDHCVRSFDVRDPDTYGYPVNGGYGSGFKVSAQWFPISDSVKIEYRSIITLQPIEPAVYEPVTVEVTDEMDLKIVAPDATVDEFITPADQQQDMRDAWVATRVDYQNQKVIARLKLDLPPVAMGMSVWLIDGMHQTRLGYFSMRQYQLAKWFKFERQYLQTPSDKVIIELRPDQVAVDHARTLGIYWGGKIQSDPITLNQPYQTPYNMDVSLAEPVETHMILNKIERPKDKQLRFYINTKDIPVRMVYQYVNAQTKQRLARYRRYQKDSNEGAWGRGVYFNIAPEMTSLDLLLVPDDDWQTHGNLNDLPWGYSILFKNIHIPEVGKKSDVTIHAKAVLHDEAEVAK